MEEVEIIECKSFYNATFLIDVNDGYRQISNADIRAGVAVSCCSIVLIVWGLVLVARHRVLKRRPIIIVAELICIVLTVLAFVGLAYAINETSPEKLLPFAKIAFDDLKKNQPNNPNAIFFLPFAWRGKTNCPESLKLSTAQMAEIRTRMGVLERLFSKRPVFIVGIVLCTATVLLFFASAISFLLLFVGKRRSTDYRNTRAVPTSFRSRPESNEAEFFSRFIEDVQQPPDNIVLSANSQCTICGEAMLEDIVRLPACGHMFHRNCVLQWLMYAVEPKCPRCDEPLRLIRNHVENERKGSDVEVP